MRQTKQGATLSKQVLLGLAAAAVLVPPAWGYVNGGDFRVRRGIDEQLLKVRGWGVGSVPLKDAGKYLDAEDVNQLVGRALQALPEKDRDRVPVEDKREVARLAREAIRGARSDSKEVIQEGQTGSLRYKVGAYAFESYWETNYGGKREIHERRSGLIPFVALRVVEPREPAGERP
jgi:hypothetical protein